MLGKTYFNMENESENAFFLLEQVYKQDPINYSALIRLAQLHERKNVYDIALQFLVKASQLPKADKYCHFLLVILE